MTNDECIYRNTVDYVSRMALEKDDFRRFLVIWEFRVTGNWIAARYIKVGNGASLPLGPLFTIFILQCVQLLLKLLLSVSPEFSFYNHLSPSY